MAHLPDFVAPMLCERGEPFDDPAWQFEVKWDGTRALAFVEAGALRLRNRRARDILTTYPEIGSLAELPSGTLLDGEIVVFEGEQPSFEGMLRREQARTAERAAALSRETPAVLIAFDCLYAQGQPLLAQPLAARLQALAHVAAARDLPALQRSEPVVGQGLAMFDAIRRQRLEGMVAKRLDAAYRPGQRSDAWRKIKELHRMVCAILGWLDDGEGALRSLVIATAEAHGTLEIVGRVGSGLTESAREQLCTELRAIPRTEPVVPIPRDVLQPSRPGGRFHWVEPQLFCRVSYLARSGRGLLRAPVFEKWFRAPRDGGSTGT